MQEFINADCMDVLPEYPDGFFDLAIVDTPYFSGPERRNFYGARVSSIGVKRLYRPVKQWNVPGKDYFDELKRVSRHQIVWGCNYFDYPFGPGRIVWDKCNPNTKFSDCEIAYCSLFNSVRLFRYMWNGMLQGKSISEGYIQQGNKALNEKRIHPTQKPVALYKWLLTSFAQGMSRLLDTHVGSASSLIAFEDLEYEYVGIEIEEYYFDLAKIRLYEYRRQMKLDFQEAAG
ncbi:MAG: DNA methyltransferase [Flexilinea sp.]